MTNTVETGETVYLTEEQSQIFFDLGVEYVTKVKAALDKLNEQHPIDKASQDYNVLLFALHNTINGVKENGIAINGTLYKSAVINIYNKFQGQVLSKFVEGMINEH